MHLKGRAPTSVTLTKDEGQPAFPNTESGWGCLLTLRQLKAARVHCHISFTISEARR